MAKRESFTMRMGEGTKAQLKAIGDAFDVPRTQVVEILIDTAYRRLHAQQEAKKNAEQPTELGPAGGLGGGADARAGSSPGAPAATTG